MFKPKGETMDVAEISVRGHQNARLASIKINGDVDGGTVVVMLDEGSH